MCRPSLSGGSLASGVSANQMPIPTGPIVVVGDIELAQSNQSFLGRQLPRVDRRIGSSDDRADDHQTLVEQRPNSGDNPRLARGEWLSSIVVLNDGVDIAERQALSARHVTKQFVSKCLFAGPRLMAFWRILVGEVPSRSVAFHLSAARSPQG